MLQGLKGDCLSKAINMMYLKKKFKSLARGLNVTKQWRIHISPLQQKRLMYTSPLE